MFVLAAACGTAPAVAQPPATVLINEVSVSPEAAVELHLSGASGIQSHGYSVVVGEHRWYLDGTGVLLPAEPMRARFNTPLELPDTGCVLLIAPDGATIVDLFCWDGPAQGGSRARIIDGAPEAEDRRTHTMGSPNSGTPDRYRSVYPVPSAIGIQPWSMLRIEVDSADLLGAERGIDVAGAHDNHSQRGRSWERAAIMFPDTNGGPCAIAIRVAGNGSRSLAKRSFHIRTGRVPVRLSGGITSTITLRADASPHAYLRNTSIAQLVRSHSLHVAIQPWVPVELFLNDVPRGSYRAMPKKDSTWISSALADGTPVEVLDGAEPMPSNGGHGPLTDARSLLCAGAPIDSIAQHMDIESLMDLACIDLFTGRADHDLNVRCWRSATARGRWQWVLYDLDLWAPITENSLERMLAGSDSEVPFIRCLFAHTASRELLTARLITLLNTVFNPRRTLPLLDSLFTADGKMLRADHLLWLDRLDRPDPDASYAEVRRFFCERPDRSMAHLAQVMGRSRIAYQVEVVPHAAGSITMGVEHLTTDTARVGSLSGVPITFEARPAEGYVFVRWDGMGGAGSRITTAPGDGSMLRAVFAREAVSSRNGLQQAGE